MANRQAQDGIYPSSYGQPYGKVQRSSPQQQPRYSDDASGSGMETTGMRDDQAPSHGGGFVPPPPLKQQLPQQDSYNHGGGFVPKASPSRSFRSSANAGRLASQTPRGQGEKTWHSVDIQSGQSPVSPASSKQHGKGISSTGAPHIEAVAVNRSELELAQYNPPRKHQRGYRNIFNGRNAWKCKFPKAFQMPNLRYETFDQVRHRDAHQRVRNGPEEDQYLSPSDGHLAKLVVQAVDDVYNTQSQASWRRTFVRSVSSPFIRVANWAINSVPHDRKRWSAEDWVIVSAKWVPACVALMPLMVIPNGGGGKSRNGGCYDSFPYRFWGYAKYWRNSSENRLHHVLTQSPQPDHSEKRPKDKEVGIGASLSYEQFNCTNPIAERLLRPRYLCFINPSPQEDAPLSVPMKVDDWLSTYEESNHPEYLFIAYTSEQFQGDKDFGALTRLAEKAAIDAGLSAYWIGSSCMPDRDMLEQDVYCISDIIRGAAGLAIVVGHPVDQRQENFSGPDLLAQWGLRMWTLPEALLSPKGERIRVYVRGSDEPWEVTKSNFAHIAWHDAPWTRQLMDHYEGSLILSQLELVVLALRCLSHRDFRRHSYFPGDLSYILMGLLRRRPQPTRDDSVFQAFARLSLANDSNMLLERLVCVQPKNPEQPWLNTDDAWGNHLWDVYPHIQVAGVGDNDTVILDGAFGAPIRWKSFAPIAYVVRDSWKRLGAKVLLRSTFIIFILSLVLVNSIQGLGAFLLVVSLITMVASPYLVRVLYGGKLWGAQPWFFGFEGYLDIDTIESNIFGAALGRLNWAPAGSPLSRHAANEFGECVGLDPTCDPEVRDLVERARRSDAGGMKVFTLVDTNTSTVTLFAARRPPIAVLLCGSEGGMQRAVLCSYEARSQTLYRESVLRMETVILQKMFRVGRFRFGFRRPDDRFQGRGAQ